MVVHTKVVRGTLPTSGNLTIPFGSTFGQPKGVKIIVSGGATDSTESTRAALSVGATDGMRNRVTATGTQRNQTGGGREKSYSFHSRNGMIAINNGTAASDGLFSFSSWNSSGDVVLTADQSPGTAYRYTAWAINGDGVEVYVDDRGSINPTQTLAITAPGFQPDLVDFFGGFAVSGSPTWINGADMSLGFSRRFPTIISAGAIWSSLYNPFTTETSAYVADNLCGGRVHNTAIAESFYVSAYSSTGFSLTEFTGENASPGGSYMAVKAPGAPIYVGTINTDAITPAGGGLNYVTGFYPQTLFGALTGVTAVNTFKSDGTACSVGFGIAGGRDSIVEGFAQLRERDAKVAPFEGGGLTAAAFARVLQNDGNVAYSTTSTTWIKDGFNLVYNNVMTDSGKWPVLAIGRGYESGMFLGMS